MIGHLESTRQFKPREEPRGGSSKGKPQTRWPLFLVVIADAVFITHKGTIDAALADRRFISLAAFSNRLNHLLPGFSRYMANHPTKKPYSNLKNRVYKMYYSGTSDRGPDHDPKTRAAVSKEHWRHKVAPDSDLALLHDQVMRGTIVQIPDWRDRL
jgi:hypothetical protein